MAIHKLYNHDRDPEEHDCINPDEIIIEEEKEEEVSGADMVQETVRNLPFFCRLFFLFGSLLLLGWSIYLTAIVIVLFILNILTLFRVAVLNETFFFGLRKAKLSLIGTLGLFVAIFSPAVGFAIFCTYLIFGDDALKNGILPTAFHKFFRNMFDR